MNATDVSDKTGTKENERGHIESSHSNTKPKKDKLLCTLI